MNIYSQKQRWKLLLLIAALTIGAASLWYTNKLVNSLADEERKKIHLWAEATRKLADISDQATDLSFPYQVISDNTTIPVILTDSAFNLVTFRNLDSVKMARPDYVKKIISEMVQTNQPIPITLSGGNKNFIIYKDSVVLVNLRYYPFFQLSVIGLFLFVSYLAFSSSRKAEQNQVWVGMAKETAHQLGTPLSSLMAWMEILKMKGLEENYATEIQKDLSRLETITERFSKIGSVPVLNRVDIYHVLSHSIEYIRSRTSDKVKISLTASEQHIIVPINVPLFEWVIENLLKNAIDAMNGEGSITISITHQHQFVYVDIADTGRGIPKSAFKTVFKPGYTTKDRGWGLGLSLSKRIIEEYHSGQVFIKNSEPNRGTTFRIVLNK